MFANRQVSVGLGLLSIILVADGAYCAPAGDEGYSAGKYYDNHAPVAVDVVGKSSVTFVFDGLSGAKGFGGHFSTTPATNGWGGPYAECHFTTGGNAEPNASMTLQCFDGFESPTEHVNMFILPLGRKFENGQPVLSHATLTVSNRGIQVEVTRIANNPYNDERKPYSITSFFPLRESTGFFSTGTIYYDGDANGVLDNTPTRTGTGYSVAPPVVR